MAKIIKVTLTSIIYKTLGDYLKDYRSPGYPSEIKNNQEKKSTDKFDWNKYAREFVQWQWKYSDQTSYQNNTPQKDKSYTNLQAIKEAFKNYPTTLEEIERIIASGQYLDLPLKPGISFAIPLEKVSREALLTHGVEVVSNNEPAFKAQALIDLESDLGYKKVFKQEGVNLHLGDLKFQYPDITVWVWCRGLSDNSSTEDHELKGQIFNITPFITSLSTSHTKSGGNFSIGLVPIVAEKDSETGKWVPKAQSLLSNDITDEVLAESYLHEKVIVDGQDQIARSQVLFHNMIGTNDLVFIRYETLKMEEEQRVKDNTDFIIDKKNLGGRIYDLIGLVDRNIHSTNFEMYTSEVNISGRDLSKLFIEDGTYFYSMENREGVFHIHGGATSKNDLMQRLISTNAYIYLGLYYNNTIEDILKFVIQQISTIKVVPDDLFESYNQEVVSENNKLNHTPSEIKTSLDKRNKRLKDKVFDQKISRRDLESSINKSKEDLLARKRTIVDKITKFRLNEFSPNPEISSLAISSTSEKIFEQLEKFIENTIDNQTADGNQIAKLTSASNSLTYTGWRQHVYNNNVVYEDTFPEEFSTISGEDLRLFYKYVDIPDIPLEYDTSFIHQDIYNYIISKRNLKKQDILGEAEELGTGIWQIVKLVIDKKVAKRMLIDSSLSSASGSLINFLKKVAQEPFVELFMDTYKDCFYIIVRQPPTDKVGMLSYLTGNYQSDTNLNDEESSLSNPAIVDIEEVDVASNDLYFDDSQVYSWYHFVPQASFIGSSSQYSTSYIPALFFPEYAEIWGSKSLDFVHNYTNYYFRYKEDSPNSDFSDMQKQSFYDMQYIVESNQYLPFSRKGTIVIKGGDRRIKIGNPVRLKATGEIFWVDSVSNDFVISNSIDRSTTIQVSRGLNETFVYGVKGSVLNEIFQNKGYRFSENKLFSYFNIINTQLNFSQTKKIKQYKTVERRVPITNEVSGNKNAAGGYNINETVNDKLDPRIDLYYGNLNSPLSDNRNESLLKTLDVKAQPIFRRFLNKLDQLGWTVIITSARRTYSQQKRLEQQYPGRAARAGTSPHEFGIALDINLIARQNINGIIQGTQLKLGRGNGRTEADRAQMKPLWVRSGVPEIAEQFGLIWGGNYTNYSDNVHFQLPKSPTQPAPPQSPPVQTTPQETVVYEQVEDGEKEVIDESAVFSNFKVDKEIFNFFLRRQQMGVLFNKHYRQMVDRSRAITVGDPEIEKFGDRKVKDE